MLEVFLSYSYAGIYFDRNSSIFNGLLFLVALGSNTQQYREREITQPCLTGRSWKGLMLVPLSFWYPELGFLAALGRSLPVYPEKKQEIQIALMDLALPRISTLSGCVHMYIHAFIFPWVIGLWHFYFLIYTFVYLKLFLKFVYFPIKF